MSLFRQHKERVEARLTTKNAQGDMRDNLSDYELMLVRLHDDILKIKSMKSTENKNRVKAQILPEYLPWIDGVTDAVINSDSDNFRQDDVFSQTFVWSIDVLDEALIESMFATICKADMTLPERFKRSPADFMLEQLAEAVIDDKKNLDLKFMHRIEDATQSIDVFDEVKAKWLKAMGTLYEADNSIEAKEKVVDYFERALQLNDKIGVKQRLDKWQKEIKKAREEVPPEKDKK